MTTQTTFRWEQDGAGGDHGITKEGGQHVE